MAEGNYSKFCGKNNDGVKKIQFCNTLAEKMTRETRSERDGKQVLSKIQHVERSFRQAHNFVTSETGAGIKEKDGVAHFEDLVRKKCPHYYDLVDVMADRASSKPKATNYELDDESDASDISENAENAEDRSITASSVNNQSVAFSVSSVGVGDFALR